MLITTRVSGFSESHWGEGVAVMPSRRDAVRAKLFQAEFERQPPSSVRALQLGFSSLRCCKYLVRTLVYEENLSFGCSNQSSLSLDSANWSLFTFALVHFGAIVIMQHFYYLLWYDRGV